MGDKRPELTDEELEEKFARMDRELHPSGVVETPSNQRPYANSRE